MESRFTTAHALIVAAAVGGAFYLAGKHLDRQPVPATSGTITVTGEGKLTIAPDIAELNFGVTTGPQKTAKAATDLLAADMQKIVEAVKAQGVDEKDIRTDSLYLNPSYDWTDGRQTLRGYEATQSLHVKVRAIEKAGDVLTAATDNGANQAGGISFTVDNVEDKRTEARTEAIADAKAKAQALADQLGETLGDVQSFSESGNGWYPPVMYAREAYGIGGGADMATNPATLPAGEQDVTVTVTVTYELR